MIRQKQPPIVWPAATSNALVSARSPMGAAAAFDFLFFPDAGPDPFGRRSCAPISAAFSALHGTAPRHASPTRPGTIFTNALSDATHALIVFVFCATLLQSFRPKSPDVFTISASVIPSTPAAFKTFTQHHLIVPTVSLASSSSRGSTPGGVGATFGDSVHATSPSLRSTSVRPD